MVGVRDSLLLRNATCARDGHKVDNAICVAVAEALHLEDGLRVAHVTEQPRGFNRTVKRVGNSLWKEVGVHLGVLCPPRVEEDVDLADKLGKHRRRLELPDAVKTGEVEGGGADGPEGGFG